MSNLSVVRLNGVDYNLEDENVRAMIAPTEASSTASAAHAPGTENEYFILDNTLYRAITNIAVGDTITAGTNCAAVPAGISNTIRKDYSVFYSNYLLHAEEIDNTIQTIDFDSFGNVQSITHSRGETIIRTDVFNFGEDTITEIRTLNTGESLSIITNTITLNTTVTYTAA